MFCRECGAKLEDNVKFCTECGAAVVSDETASETAETNETAETAAETAETNETAETTDTVDTVKTDVNETTETIEKVEAEVIENDTEEAGTIPTAKAEVVVPQSGSGDSFENNSYKPPIDASLTSVLAYITWIGWIVAYCAGDRENAKFHLNQALVIKLLGLATAIPYIGSLWGIFIFVCWIMGLVYAAQQTEKEVPLIGKIHILQ